MTYGLAVLVCLGAFTLLLFTFENADAAWAATHLCSYLVLGCVVVFDVRLSHRQIARDLEAAKIAIRRPLRYAVFGEQKPMDLDPYFPTVSPNGRLVHALDPGRRSMRYIMCGWIDADNRTWDDGGPLAGIVTSVSQATLPVKRRWFGLLAARNPTGNTELAISMLEEGKETTIKLHFQPDDRAVDGWRRTFEQWMYEDQQRTRNPVDASNSLRHP